MWDLFPGVLPPANFRDASGVKGNCGDRDRVLHHAIMGPCEPVFERWLIDDTYACRRGKGRIKCLLRAVEFSRRFPFYLKLDARKCFDGVSHEVLLSRLGRVIENRDVLNLFARIVRTFRPGCVPSVRPATGGAPSATTG